jgi:His/Glu/Gln/Arg/opine family amino acid ABC transporter permease subunit
MDWELILDSIPTLLKGLLVTFEIVLLSLFLGGILAVPLALLRISRHAIAWMPVYAYIYVMRGTPLLVQLYLIYYGSAQIPGMQDSVLWPFFKQAWYCAILAFTLNTAAYQAEIFRGAILAVPHGEVEAARAVGMSPWLLYRRIILPRAFRIGLPAYTNEVILMLQASALASLVTIRDLMGTADAIVNRTYNPWDIYIPTALIYLIVTYALVWLFRKLEYRLSGHLRERPTARILASHGPEPAGAGLR